MEAEGDRGRDVFCEKTPEAVPAFKSVPAASKVDPLLAKMGLAISNVGVTSVITYLRKGKKLCIAALREKSEKM